jgi:hypothetical protein
MIMSIDHAAGEQHTDTQVWICRRDAVLQNAATLYCNLKRFRQAIARAFRTRPVSHPLRRGDTPLAQRRLSR